MADAPPRPVCPSCGMDNIVFIHHGYVELEMVWSDPFGEWVGNPDSQAFVLGWNGGDQYHQCNSCFWQCHFSDLTCPYEEEW